VLQRLLTIVETQTQTLELQARKIQALEEQHLQYAQALSQLESKLDGTHLSAYKGEPVLEDDEGHYVEV